AKQLNRIRLRITIKIFMSFNLNEINVRKGILHLNSIERFECGRTIVLCSQERRARCPRSFLWWDENGTILQLIIEIPKMQPGSLSVRNHRKTELSSDIR